MQPHAARVRKAAGRPETSRVSTPKYTDFTQFILGITEEIWEQRKIDLLHQYYSDDIMVRSPEALTRGNKAVIAATMATLAEFPDRQLLGEDVIWGHTGENSWISSHRIFSTATHDGSGKYGSASSTNLRYRIIAECHAEEDERNGWRINDEWIIRDQGAIARQIGYEPREFVHATLAGELPPVSHFVPKDDVLKAPYSGRGNNAEPGLRYQAILERMMGAGFSAIPEEYDRACQLHIPGGRAAHGFAGAESFWLGLRAALPDAEFRIEHRLGRSDPGLPERAAIRWSLEGRHSGGGAFGPPTGRDIHILGMSHAEFGNHGIRAEYNIYDEIAIWHQLLS
ncbi:MAG: ester cyclase [Rhodobacteraceae bacterium]|nr:ester cyclase [Paracoccaceae bacterium]